MMIIIISTIVIAMSIGGLFLEPYVIMCLFNWFAVPAFGCPALSYGFAWGIGLLVSFMTYHFHDIEPNMNNEEKYGITSFEYDLSSTFAESAMSIVISLFALGIGAIIAAAIGVL